MASFGWSLSAPFLFDDYGHVSHASTQIAGDVWRMFGHAQGEAYRPVGFAFFYLNFKVAHFNQFGWHVFNLCAHILNSCLFFVLLSLLEFPIFPAAAAATLFAVNGTRAEPVCWADARFDLLATLFVLLALISILNYARSARVAWVFTAAVCALLAFATKESSFALPLLPLALLPFCEAKERRKLLKLVPWACLLALVVFAYRWWLVGSIGGYFTNGSADILHFTLFQRLKAVAWRLWALCFFPVNWVAPVQKWLASGLILFCGALAVIVARARISWACLAGALAFTVAATIPVQHLLLIGADLAGARLLYLPFAGVALLWAVILDGLKARPVLQDSIAAVILLFNVLALEHNIAIWRHVAYTSQRTCQAFGKEIANTQGQVFVSGVPAMLDGVYFLSNGFPQCVELNAHVPASRIVTAGAGGEAAAYGYHWDSASLSFKRSSFEPSH